MSVTRKKIEETVIDLLGLPEDSVLDNNLKKMGINSLTFVKLIVNLESKFGISIPDEFLSMDKFKSIDDIVNYITIEAVN